MRLASQWLSVILVGAIIVLILASASKNWAHDDKSTEARGAPDIATLQDLRAENLRLRSLLAAHNSVVFEQKNSLRSSFDNCKVKSGELQCSAFTASGAPISYRCDLDSCSIDCGALEKTSEVVK